jgi:hypothetical protein
VVSATAIFIVYLFAKVLFYILILFNFCCVVCDVFSYLELVTALGKESPIFALDDGVLMSGKEFEFDSIEEVAEQCYVHALQVATAHGVPVNGHPHRRQIVIGGWSYGGVVAVELGKLIRRKQQHCAKSAAPQIEIEVTAVVLFDSPVRQPNKQHDADYNSQAYRNLTGGATTTTSGGGTSGGGEADVNEVAVRTATHFSACTDLLKKYHARAPEEHPLRCPVFDIRPEESDYLCGIEAIQELTSEKAQRSMVLGSHWTMLFGQFVPVVAGLVRTILNKK